MLLYFWICVFVIFSTARGSQPREHSCIPTLTAWTSRRFLQSQENIRSSGSIHRQFPLSRKPTPVLFPSQLKWKSDISLVFPCMYYYSVVVTLHQFQHLQSGWQILSTFLKLCSFCDYWLHIPGVKQPKYHFCRVITCHSIAFELRDEKYAGRRQPFLWIVNVSCLWIVVSKSDFCVSTGYLPNPCELWYVMKGEFFQTRSVYHHFRLLRAVLCAVASRLLYGLLLSIGYI